MPEPEPQGDINATLERVLGILKRRRWWALSAFAVVALGTSAVLAVLPNRYSSSATLIVAQQQVPERYVVPTTTTTVNDALQAMTQEVLSRTRLDVIIDELGLYAGEKKRLAPEEIIDLMRSNIGIKAIEDTRARNRDVNAFTIAFTCDNPRLAQQVTSRLTSLFIAENLRSRENQATTTTNFLEQQLKVAETKLAQQEERIRNFKMQNLGELPEQEQANLTILAGLQSQLQNTSASLNRAQQQRVYLTTLLDGYRGLANQAASSSGTPLPAAAGPEAARILSPLDVARAELARLQTEKVKLLAAYTPQHPDVQKTDQQIQKTEVLIEQLSKSQASPVTGRGQAQAATAGPDATASAIAQAASQLEANRLEIANLSRDEEKLKANIAEYQNRLNQTPAREQQLAAVLRDRELLNRNYADLLSKKQEAALATTLEKEQGGQQFRVIDPPSLPQIPTSPKRLKICLGGLAGGLFLGIALAFFMDMRDRSFHSERMLAEKFPAPIVVAIPRVLSAPELRKRFWLRALEWVGASGLVIVVFLAELYVYRLV